PPNADYNQGKLTSTRQRCTRYFFYLDKFERTSTTQTRQAESESQAQRFANTVGRAELNWWLNKKWDQEMDEMVKTRG
ncbi:hypothetical protein ACXWPL_09530, partial [Streptococcus pyogenes]